jgi:hypothetical protein
MEITTIIDPEDRRFPFSRDLFEDLNIVYHGTWSIYARTIESKGFSSAELPFDEEDFVTIGRAWKAVGILDSYAEVVFSRNTLSMVGNFWSARNYATDGGGEVVRIMLREAREFEALCLQDEKRLALKRCWEEGLKKSPGHLPTMEAVAVLSDRELLNALYCKVAAARERIEDVTKNGFPVVYAIRVEPEWFGNRWEKYIYDRELLGNRGEELRCNRDRVTQDRICAKADYPNGTDGDLQIDGFKTWADIEAYSGRFGSASGAKA